MARFEAEFYEKENGEQPAREFLLSLDKKMRAKMLMIIGVLQDNGYELREPYSKHLSEGIFELRAQVGSDISRVLYFFYVDQHIVLTNGFIKKTQKTPPQEIEKAKKYRADYLSRRRKKMSVKFDDFLKEQMQDPEIKKEYDDLQPERAIIQALIDARLQTGMTQKELSEKTGIAQGDISKLERGNSNPSIRTLQRLAAGMGMSIQLKFIPSGNV